MKKTWSRRAVLRGAMVVGGTTIVTGTASQTAHAEAHAEEEGRVQDSPKEETKKADAIMVDDTRIADKIAGRDLSLTNDAERELMTGSMEQMRERLKTIRSSPLSVDMEPATHFTPRLPGMVIPKGGSKVSLSRGKNPLYNGEPESLAYASVVELSRLLKARKITSRTLTEMYLERLKRYGDRLLCVVNLTEELARFQADRADREIAGGKYRGALHGIPYGLKDLFATRAIPTTYGAKPYEFQVMDTEATVVRRLEEAGAVLVAKLSMGELAMGDVWMRGRTRNPWNPKRGSSGSSAGPGSATAAGLVGFSIGTETYGSIISPSAANGVTGLRPTYGRVSRHGAMALSWTLDKIGPMCRTVEDCALVFAAIHGADGFDPTAIEGIPFRWEPGRKGETLRVGIDETAWTATVSRSEENARIYNTARTVLEKQGIRFIPITLPKDPAYDAIISLIIGVEGSASFTPLTLSGGLRELAQQANWNWPNTFRVASTVSATEYVQALRLRAHLQKAMYRACQEVDCYITPSLTGPSLAHTNLCGYPEISLRCGMRENGLPVSLSVVGLPYREDAIVHVAYAYERATEWHKQWPSLDELPETPPEEETD